MTGILNCLHNIISNKIYISTLFIFISILFLFNSIFANQNPNNDRNKSDNGYIQAPILETETQTISIELDPKDYINVLVLYDESDNKIYQLNASNKASEADFNFYVEDATYKISLKTSPNNTYIPESISNISMSVDSDTKQNSNMLYLKKIEYRIPKSKITSWYIEKVIAASTTDIKYDVIFKNTAGKDSSRTLDIAIMTCGFDVDTKTATEGYTYDNIFDEAVKSITTGSFFKDYTSNINIIRIQNKFSEADLGCQSAAGKYTNINEQTVQRIKKAINAEVAIVLTTKEGAAGATIYAGATDESDKDRFLLYGNIRSDRIYTANTNYKRLVHELGHSFCTLHDEQELGLTTGLPYPTNLENTIINCKSNKNNFPLAYKPDSDYIGCLYKDGYRSTKESLMGTSSPDFNKLGYDTCVRAMKAIDPQAAPAPVTEPSAPPKLPTVPPVKKPNPVKPKPKNCDIFGLDFCYI